MTAISAPDLAILGYQYRRVSNLKINIPELSVVASAEIDTAPVAYPTAEIATTNESNWTIADRDLLVRIVGSSTLRYEGALRVDATTGVLPIAGIVEGDTGIARRTISTLTAGDDIFVYDLPVPFSFLSRIASDGTFYKLWNVAFTGQTATPRPQPILGTDQQSTVASGGTAQFTLDASGSYSWNGNSLNYGWVLPVGVSLVGGSLSDATITVEADEGNHSISCQVTDSVTGQYNRGYRRLYVNSPSALAFGDEYAIDNLNITHDRTALTVTFDIITDGEEIDAAKIFTGQQVCITWDYEFSNDGTTWVQPSEASLSRKTIRAWIRSWTTSQNADYIQTTSVEAVDIISYADGLIMASQVMIRENAPSRWVEVPSDFMNLAGYIQYVIDWHCSAIFKLCDFDYGDFDTVTFADFKVNAGTVGDAIRNVQRYVPGSTIVMDTDGTLTMRRALSYEMTTYRDALPIRMDIDDQYVIEQISYSQRAIKPYNATESGCFVDGTPVTAFRYRRALSAPQQGAGRASMPDFIATSEANGQWYTGQHHERVNADVQSISYGSFVDAYSVALRDVVDLSISDPRFDDVTNNTRAEIMVNSWRLLGNGDIDHSVTFEIETLGGYAETIPLDPVDYTEFDAPKNPLLPDDGSDPDVPSKYTWDFTKRQGGWEFNWGLYEAGKGLKQSNQVDQPGTLRGGEISVFVDAPSPYTVVRSMTIVVRADSPILMDGSLEIYNEVGLAANGPGIPDPSAFIVPSSQLEAAYKITTVPFTDLTIEIEEIDLENGDGIKQRNRLVISFSADSAYYSPNPIVNYYIESVTIFYDSPMKFATRTS